MGRRVTVWFIGVGQTVASSGGDDCYLSQPAAAPKPVTFVSLCVCWVGNGRGWGRRGHGRSQQWVLVLVETER